MRRHCAVVNALVMLISQIMGAIVYVERRADKLRRILRDRMQEGQMDLIVTELNGALTYIDVETVSAVVSDAQHLWRAASERGYAALGWSTLSGRDTH